MPDTRSLVTHITISLRVIDVEKERLYTLPLDTEANCVSANTDRAHQFTKLKDGDGTLVNLSLAA